MAKDRTQLNINIDPELLLLLKSEAIKNGKTLTTFITEKLKESATESADRLDLLENRLLKIEKMLELEKTYSARESLSGSIFTDEGAKRYGEVAKSLFESHFNRKKLNTGAALQELSVYLDKYDHSNPELVFQILLGTHELTGKEMTNAYRKGSCAMRTALMDWSQDPLEELNEAFLSAVITKTLA